MKSLIPWILLFVYFLIGIFVSRLLCGCDDFNFFIMTVWPIAVICLIAFGILAIPIKLADSIIDYVKKVKESKKDD